MTYGVILAPEAEADLRTAYRHIRSQAPHAAREWIRRARQSVRSLARIPSDVRWLLRVLCSTNRYGSCFLAREIEAHIASCS